MQDKTTRRSNHERSEASRRALLGAARALFVQRGYGDTSTPDIAESAGVTRGALYHHFKDKEALFRAVVEEEAKAVAGAIEAGTSASLAPREALVVGASAYLDAMEVPGRTRLLLLDGPAVLGHAVMQSIDEQHAAATLRDGLAAVAAQAATCGKPRYDEAALAALASLLSAAFDRAALDIDAGADPLVYRFAIGQLLANAI